MNTKPKPNKIPEPQIKREAILNKEIKTRMITIVTTAMTVVAALFWQTAITDTIKAFIPVGGVWSYEIIVALIVTAITAWLVYWLNKSLNSN